MPIWSPDGSRIAYVRGEYPLLTLYALSFEDGRELRVVDFENVLLLHGQIVWSPDGHQLAVPLQASSKRDLFSFDLRSGDLRRLPVAIGPSTSPSLIGGGTAMVVRAPGGLTLEGFDGTSRPVPCEGPNARLVGWSQDGQRFLCAGSRGLQVADIETGQSQSLVEDSVDSAIWSPDESAVAFVHLEEDRLLSVLDTVTGEVKDIATELRSNPAGYYYNRGDYAWSPDGKWVAFTNWRAINSAANPGASTISVIGADGENLRQIVDSPGTKRDLVFSPDGEYVAYIDSEAGMAVVNVATGEKTTVSSGTRDRADLGEPVIPLRP